MESGSHIQLQQELHWQGHCVCRRYTPTPLCAQKLAKMPKKGPARKCRPKAASTQARFFPDGTVMPSLEEALKEADEMYLYIMGESFGGLDISTEAPAGSLQQPMGRALPPEATSASVAIQDEEHVVPVPTEPQQQPFNLEMELDQRVAVAVAGAVIVKWWKKLLHPPEVFGDEEHVSPRPEATPPDQPTAAPEQVAATVSKDLGTLGAAAHDLAPPPVVPNAAAIALAPAQSVPVPKTAPTADAAPSRASARLIAKNKLWMERHTSEDDSADAPPRGLFQIY